jgi:hypothetical protein
MYGIQFIPEYDVSFIVCAVLFLIIINEFFIDNPLGGTAFILLFISYGAGRYVGSQKSSNID